MTDDAGVVVPRSCHYMYSKVVQPKFDRTENKTPSLTAMGISYVFEYLSIWFRYGSTTTSGIPCIWDIIIDGGSIKFPDLKLTLMKLLRVTFHDAGCSSKALIIMGLLQSLI